MKKIVYTTLSALMLSGPLLAVQPQELFNEQQNEATTKDGVKVRKGTLLALFVNAQEFNRLVGKPDSPEKQKQIDKIVADLREVIPTATNLGLFKFFTPDEWIEDSSEYPGRALVGLIYLEKNPQAVNADVKDTLDDEKDNAPKELKPYFPKS